MRHGDRILGKQKKKFVGAYNNLKTKKYGSFKVMKKISDNTYIVDLPSYMAVPKTFIVADYYGYHRTKQLYLVHNSRNSPYQATISKS